MPRFTMPYFAYILARGGFGYFLINKTYAYLSDLLKSDGDGPQIDFDELAAKAVDQGHHDVSELLLRMKGIELHVPNLWFTLRDWPHGLVNPGYKRLVPIIDAMLERAIDDPRELAGLKKGDFALFCCLWWPTAEWENLLTGAHFVTWLFVWDDTIDEGHGKLALNLELGDQYRRETIEYLARTLGVDAKLDSRDDNSAQEDHNAKLLTGKPKASRDLFERFAERLRATYDEDHLRRFFRELKRYVLACGVEQMHCRTGYLPTVEEYIRIRLGTTCVDALSALNEMALGISLPPSIMDSSHVASIWMSSNLGVIYLNDLLSLRKELDGGHIYSYVPILINEAYHVVGDAHAVVQQVQEKLEKCVQDHDTAARKLLKLARGDQKLEQDIQTYLRSSRSNVTATYSYSLLSKRYGITKDVQTDGSVELLF